MRVVPDRSRWLFISPEPVEKGKPNKDPAATRYLYVYSPIDLTYTKIGKCSKYDFNYCKKDGIIMIGTISDKFRFVVFNKGETIEMSSSDPSDGVLVGAKTLYTWKKDRVIKLDYE